MTISNDGTGAMIEIALESAADDDPKFVEMMDFGDGRTMHVRDNGEGVEEVVVVYTDIEAPKATAFAMVDGQTLDVDFAPTVDADNDGNVANDFTALSVATDGSAEQNAATFALVMSGAFTPGAGSVTELTFARYQEDSDNNMDGDQTIEAFTAAGTYNGAMGTYTCNDTSDDCTVTLNAEGMITAMSDSWAFTPDAGATSDVADADFLNYGFWLQRTTDEDGVLTYDEVETFAESSVAVSGSVADVTGSATYAGGAVGVYVRNVFDSEGVIETATSGHFSADANLTAYFGQVLADADDDTSGTIAPNLLNTLSGSISNFDLSGGEANEWAVNLQGDIATATGTIENGTANGGGAEGSLSGTFHGSVAGVDHDDDNTTPNIFPQPSSVVGEFGANFSNGTVAGGFGARRQ